MRIQAVVPFALATFLIAAAPGPDPVITLDGVTAAAKLSPSIRAGIAPRVTALNAALEKMVASHKREAGATSAQRTQTHEAMKTLHGRAGKPGGIHEALHGLHGTTNAADLHAQMKAHHASGDHPAELHEAMEAIHAIIEQLDPEQRAAFIEYLHAQLEAAGMPHPHAAHGVGTQPHG